MMKLTYDELFREVKKCKTNAEINEVFEKIFNQEETIDFQKKSMKENVVIKKKTNK